MILGSAHFARFAPVALRCALVGQTVIRLRLLIFVCTWHPSCGVLEAEDNRSNSLHGSSYAKELLAGLCGLVLLTAMRASCGAGKPHADKNAAEKTADKAKDVKDKTVKGAKTLREDEGRALKS